ncbi:uncharacterized protein LOC122638931 [Telopea speciosissima]|uniref:uncharacterized protein LOC122638931 n=1 Tax=Telopea speciosissima TaxID=54955 RepID=UPI001CC798D4|nr:uncharacterized protein LOC122638931 [Telopea speciosissima]
MPTIEQYGGTTDSEDHLEKFKSLMFFQGASDAIMCRAFPSTLKVRHWVAHLKPQSLSSFVELRRAFLTNFMSSRVHKKTTTNILAIQHGSGETIRDFLTRFNNEALEVRNLDPIVKFQAMHSGIRDVELKKSLIMDEPIDMYELFSRCEKHINLAEVLVVKKEKEIKPDKKGLEKKRFPTWGKTLEGWQRPERWEEEERRLWVPRSDSKSEPMYTALTHNRAYILNEIKDQVTLRWPTKMIKPAHDRNKNKYCRFY